MQTHHLYGIISVNSSGVPLRMKRRHYFSSTLAVARRGRFIHILLYIIYVHMINICVELCITILRIVI